MGTPSGVLIIFISVTKIGGTIMNLNRLSFKFSHDMYLKMLTDDLINDEELRDAIINDFMNSIKDYRRIRENELTSLLQKYARKL